MRLALFSFTFADKIVQAVDPALSLMQTFHQFAAMAAKEVQKFAFLTGNIKLFCSLD